MTGNIEERREYARQVISCKAILRIPGKSFFPVLIKDFCAGGLLLVQEDKKQHAIGQRFASEQILELLLQEPSLSTPVRVKCVHVEKYALGVQFMQNGQACVAALVGFDHRQSVEASALIPRQNALKTATTVVICDRLANRVASCLDAALSQFFKVIFDVKHDPDVLMNIRGAVAVNEVLDFLKLNSRDYISHCIDENRLFFKNLQLDVTVKKTETEFENKKMEVTTLNLVDKVDFEEWLSAKLVANKSDAEIKNEWQALLIRLGFLVGRVIDHKTIPFSPVILCERLREQILASSGHPPRNVVNKIYTLFYQHVLSQLLILVEQLNVDLAAAGCLPGADVYKPLPAHNNFSVPRKPIKKDVEKSDIEKNDVEKVNASAGISAGTGGSLALSQGVRFVVLEKKIETTEKKLDAVSNKFVSLENKIDTTEKKMAAVSNSAAITNMSFLRPEQSITAYPISDSLSHARFLSSKALRAVKHLLNMQQALLSPVDIRKQQQADAEYGLSPVDLLDMINRLQLEVATGAQYLQAGLRAALESHLIDSNHLTMSQLLSLSVVEKIFQILKENAEFDKSLHDILDPLALLVFKALLIDDTLLRDEQHPVRQVINAIAYLGCRSGVKIRGVQQLLQQAVKILLRDFDRDHLIFLKILTPLLQQIVDIRASYQRNLHRVQDRYDGMYKIERARKMTLAAIDSLLLGKRVAPLLLNILDMGFRDALCLAHAKQGENSKFWKIGLLAIEELAVITANNNANWSLLKLQPSNLFKLVQSAFNNFSDKKQEQAAVLAILQQVIATRKGIAEADLLRYQPLIQSTEKSLSNISVEGKWSDRIQCIKVGDAFLVGLVGHLKVIANCAWIAPDRSRYVIVDHSGVVIADSSSVALIEKFSKRQWRLSDIEDLPIFDQGLDILIEKIYNELTHHVARDELTGLLNRKGFENEINACLHAAQNASADHVLAYFSLNQFNILNAACGFDAGDNFLKIFSKQLLMNINEHVVMARLGGTEFGLLLKHYDEQAALRFVEALLEKIQALKFEWENKIYQVGVSFGVVRLHSGYLDVRKALQDSQLAASIAKDKGGRRIHVLIDDQHQAAKIDHISSWVTKIDEVLATDALRLRIHKIQSITEHGSPSKVKPHYEVLLSIGDGDQFLPPFEFICAAERYQRIGEVDSWVIKKVFEWLISHQEEQAEIGMLSINLSGYSLNDGRLMKYIFEAFASSKVPCEKICFEITETVALTDLDDVVDFMVELKNLGCFFALDDFGTGSASYQYLKRLPIDFIKIDGSFVREMKHNRQDWAMVKSITDLGHLMGIRVIAEYVEDEETLEQLKIIGVDYAQGYHIEKPKWL